MEHINATTARKNFYRLISDVNDNASPVVITNARGKNAVILSEDDWNALQETLYLNSVPGFAESIRKADEEGIAGGIVYDPDKEW